MDNKNVFVAIALSMSVLLFWGAFFETPRQDKNLLKESSSKVNEKVSNEITLNIGGNIFEKSISRKDALAQVDRVPIENENVQGSISLKGAIFDDLSFKKYKQTLKNDNKVVFLNPKDTEDGYFIETGWTSVGNKLKVPSIETEWKVKGNKNLTDKDSVTLEWNNGEGLTLKEIELDEKYLFKINQSVRNNTSSEIELYPYAQISRNKKPDDVQGFYILHEGFIGVFDGELKEDSYSDIEKGKYLEKLIMAG